MADNIAVTAGVGTTIATDDIAGVQVQRVKVTWGADGVMNDANASTPLPVDTELPAAAALADAAANPTTPILGAASLVFNGTTWDRLKEAVNALNSTGTGIPTAQLVAQFDDTSPTAITENQFGNVRMSANRNVYVTVRDAAGNERGLNIDASNRLTVAHSSLVAGTAMIGSVGGPDVIDAPITQNPLFVSGRASTAVPTAVSADNDIQAVWVDRRGAQKIVVVDDAGVSAMDGTNNAIKVNVVAGAAGGTQYTEDAAAAADPVGTVPMLVRKDTPATTVSADGDNIAQRGTNYGAAYVQLVTSAGAYIDSVGGGTEYTEDAVATANPIGKATILVRTDTPATQVSADGDNIAQRGTNYGAAYVQLLTSAGAYIDSIGGGTQYTEDAASAANPIGTHMMMRRRDTLSASEVSADLDVIAANATSKGELYVKHTDPIPVTNVGTFAVQDSQGVTDNAAFTDGTTKLFCSGYVYDEVAGTALTENDAAAGRINVNRAVVSTIEDGATRGRYATVSASNALKVDGSAVTQPISGNLTIIPGTSGGCTSARAISAASTNATSVKASAGQLYGYSLFNNGLTAVYFKFYNKASAPTVGSDTPVLTLMVPAESGLNLNLANGIVFGTGIAYAVTTGMADADTVAVAVTQVAINLWYK